MKKYIKENWIFLLFCFALTAFSFQEERALVQEFIIKAIIYLVICPLSHYIFIARLGADKSGPIQLHQSPVVWVGIPVMMIIIYVLV